MSGTTTKGFPYSSGGDGAATIDNTMQALAQFIDDFQNGMTTVNRDLLASALKWDGRIIYNTTNKRHERWDAAASKWRVLAADGGDAFLFSIL